MTLFETQAPRPLADRLRPTRLAEVVGQDHLLQPEAPIGRMVAEKHLSSLILWGPPGCGKTTIARLLAHGTDLHFEPLSAVFSGVADLRRIFEAAAKRRAMGQGTLLFVDEIHRFNRAQQDGFLPYVEDGTIVLVGATTENPSFELNGALLSRAQVFVLNRLDEAAIEMLLQRAEVEEKRKLPLTAGARERLKALADGDGRFALNLVEILYTLPAGTELDEAGLADTLQRRAPLYDKSEEGHYNLISALHKSVRGSDVDAALYWFCRMLDGGEDPRYLARRLTRMAVEDIGLADPQALPLATSAWETYERLGSPEGELALAEMVIYLASAPKSNAAYVAFGAAKRAAKAHGSLMPPKHILNAPTKLMKTLGYGQGYTYDHDAPEAFSGQNYFPDEVPREQFYQPVDRGYERELTKRLEHWAKLRAERQGEMMENFLAVAFGGATGSVLRYGVIIITLRMVGAMPYYATLTVNLIGCLVMGFFAETVLVKAQLPESVKLLATTGLLGGFTTFSSFAFDAGRLVNEGNPAQAVLYVLASVVGGIALFFLGLYLARFV